MEDFFISYNKADNHWAMGIGDWLDRAGFSVILQEQDFVPSTNFVGEMHKALKSAKRMIMVLSPDYLAAKFPFAEWTAQFATDPSCEKGTLIPVRVRECTPDGLLRPIVYIDLVGFSESEAHEVFLNGITSVLNRKRAATTGPQRLVTKKPKRANLSQNVKGNNNTSIQAGKIHNVTFKMTGKKPPTIQPPDVVGANVEMRAYIEYLVERYIDWRQKGIKRGIDKRAFHPSMIHRDIKRDFGARTYLVPQGRFQDLVHYLQVRINETINGRNNPHRNYHSFEEHLNILHGNKSGKVTPSDAAEGASLPETLLGAVQSGIRSAQQKAHSISCTNNLKQVGLAARIWAGDHGDIFPSNFALMKEELGNNKITYCPSNNTVPYEILSPAALITNPSVVYARCNHHNHLVLVDGSVQQLGNRQLVQKDGQWTIQ